MTEIVKVGIGLGSNLGNCEENVMNALNLLEESGLVPQLISSLIQTKPLGFESSNVFVNGVGIFETTKQPLDVLQLLLEIELVMGRKRKTIGYADRIIDLDLLFYGESILSHPQLVLPHPRMHEREFVLMPLVEVCPDWVHPMLKQTASVLLKALQTASDHN
jgi:2-amino-4-hydroxy-6-hydroxymethyldihydropteridine diphosphokinase